MRIFLSAAALLLANLCFTQGDADLFRYSKTDIQGGARFEAMGGSFGALGADFSSSQINPAGFGRYSTTQFGTSFGLNKMNNSLLFRGNKTNISENVLKLNTLGLVYVEDASANKEGLLYTQFGLGYNNLQNYTNSVRYEGEQFESLLDEFAYNAYGTNEFDLSYSHPFSSYLAYVTNTIYSDPNNPSGYLPSLNLMGSGNQYHKREVLTKGGMNEYFVSYSANYMNRLYLGGNIGFRTIRYDETTNHHEDVLDTLGNTLRSFDYTYHLNTKGNGFNLKLGVIYLPQDNLRIGLAFHSATYYNLTDKTDADMVAVFYNQTSRVNDSLKPYGDYKYRLRTPPKLVGSIAYIFGTRGCVNMDVEYVNYKWANLRTTKDIENYQAYDFTTENSDAKKVLKSALNVRLGGELVFNSIFFVRGGLRLSSNAYKKDLHVEIGTDRSYSCGIGYKSGNMAIDLSYRYSIYSRTYTAFYQSSAEHRLKTQGFTLSANYVLN